MKKKKVVIRDKTPETTAKKKVDKTHDPIGSFTEYRSTVNVFKKTPILKNKSKISGKKELNKSVIISESTKDTTNITNNINNKNSKTNNNAKSVSKGEVIMKRIITKNIKYKVKKKDSNDNSNTKEVMNKTADSFYKPKINPLKKSIKTSSNKKITSNNNNNNNNDKINTTTTNNNNKTNNNNNNNILGDIKRKETFDIRATVTQKKMLQKREKENLNDKSFDAGKPSGNNRENAFIKRQATVMNGKSFDRKIPKTAKHNKEKSFIKRQGTKMNDKSVDNKIPGHDNDNSSIKRQSTIVTNNKIPGHDNDNSFIKRQSTIVTDNKIPMNNKDNSSIKRQSTTITMPNKIKRNPANKATGVGKMNKEKTTMLKKSSNKDKKKDIPIKKKLPSSNIDNKSGTSAKKNTISKTKTVNSSTTNVKANTNVNANANTNTDNKTKDEKVEIKKEIKYSKIRNKKYDSNYLECLYLTLNSGFFNPNKKIKIILNSKELYKNIDKKNIIKELIDYYKKIGNENSIKKNGYEKYDMKKIIEPFKPTEKSINALNFFDKEEEQKLINEIQHPYINEFFKVLLILLNEFNEYNNNKENKNIFEFLFNDIFQKNKVNNIKKLMINNFINTNFIINDEQFELIQKILKVKSDLLSPATMLRYNRALAYFTFFMKELYAYLNLKTDDGQYFFSIRKNLPKNEYQEKINKLQLLLNK